MTPLVELRPHIDEALAAKEGDRLAHSWWDRFWCARRGHRGSDGYSASHTYRVTDPEDGRVRAEIGPICDRCGAMLPRTCRECGRPY
jgi:hypothetical protein